MENEIISDNIDLFRILFSLFQTGVKTDSQFLIRCQSTFLHDWIHITVYKALLWKSFPKGTVNIFQITSHKMMKTDRKKQNNRWFSLQAL